MKLLILLLILSSFSCSNHKVINYEKIADRITSKTAKKLETEKELHLIGTGGGMMNHVRMMAMSFIYNHEIDVDTGRELLITATNEYLKAINSNEEIRPHLANYPFEPKNIEIRIFIRAPNKTRIPEGEISVISSVNGILKYDADEGNDYKRIYRETFGEALQKLAQKKAA